MEGASQNGASEKENIHQQGQDLQMCDRKLRVERLQVPHSL